MNGTRVLVVEDDRLIAAGIAKRLRVLGYAVVGQASSGDEGVSAARALRPDLVLMDIHLGRGIDGIEAARRLREELDVPVVFLTAHSDEATLQRAKLSGPHGYVLKPYEDRDLQTAIEVAVQRHGMDRRVRESEAWLTATLRSIGDAVIATDEAGQVRFMNPLAEQLTGWSQEEAAGRHVESIFHIVHEHTRAPVLNPAVDALALGVPVTLSPDTILIDRHGVERPIDDSAAPIRARDGAVAGGVLVFRDISEKRELESNLRQAQKMEAIGRLAGGIAHDFNNIMTVITGFSELLISGEGDTEERQAYARHIHEAGRRAAALTQQIMAFSRKQVLRPERLNANAVIRDMSAMVQRLIGSNIEFLVDLAPDLHDVHADPAQLGQVFLNLAVNARDAMPRGGELTIATSNVEVTAGGKRKEPDLAPGAYVLLTVQDTGIGMTPAVLRNIFEPFFTTKAIGQGTGLGLATVFGIVKQSRGHIAADSVEGRGTTFRVYLPAIFDHAHGEATPKIPEATAAGSGTVLLVEDDATVRRLTRRILEQSGYTVLEAANGAEALTLAQQGRRSFDLLLTDLMMPKLSGADLAAALRLARPTLPVVFMSGYADDVVQRQLGKDDAIPTVLAKPFTIEGLRAAVEGALRSA